MATMLDSETYRLQQAQAGQLLSDYLGARADRLPGFDPQPERATLNGEARLRIIETLTKVIRGAYWYNASRAAQLIDHSTGAVAPTLPIGATVAGVVCAMMAEIRGGRTDTLEWLPLERCDGSIRQSRGMAFEACVRAPKL